MDTESKSSCEVCDGEGRCLIFDKHGKDRFSVVCPECFGSGEVDDDSEEDNPDWPPASSAASITSTEQMHDHIKEHWSKEAKK